MFECRIKNLIQFKDKRDQRQSKIKSEILNDIVLYVQDEKDFYRAWENVFKGEVPDYQSD